MNEKNVFVIDDGTKEITLKNKYDEIICVIHVRAGEMGIIDRYNEIVKDIDDIVAPLKNTNLNVEGKAEFARDWQTVKGVEAALTERLNTLLDFNEAEKIFAKRSMFSIVGGKFFFEVVLDALGNMIKADVTEEVKKMEKRLAKYTDDLDTQMK